MSVLATNLCYPHNQGEPLYMALNMACKDAIFISLLSKSMKP